MKTKIKNWWNKKSPEKRHTIIWQLIMIFTLTAMLLLALVI